MNTINGYRYSDLHVAIVCHNALIGMTRVHEMMRGPAEGDAVTTDPFVHLNPDLRDAAIHGVMLARRGVTRPEDHHGMWVAFLVDRGWEEGPRDPDRKTHPNLKPWHWLDLLDQDKNREFLATVIALTIT